MCGRFTLRTPLNVLVEHFMLDSAPQLPLRFNIAPTQQIAVIRPTSDHQGRSLDQMRWGLIPSWAKDPAIGNRMINARAESVAEKPAFRAAFKRRRCLIPADGYYEWQKVGKRKQPYYIHMEDDHPFALAGLWESWRGSEESVLESCTIITTDASQLTRPIHDRMPAILDTQDYQLWLDDAQQDNQRLLALLQPYENPRMRADPVSTYVNYVRNDDPKCIEIQRELF